MINVLSTIKGKYQKNKVSKHKNVKFMKHTGFDNNTQFEGGNYIGNNIYLSNVSMGYGAYIQGNTYLFNTRIGRFTCVGSGLKVVSGQHPSDTFVSIHPSFYSINPITKESYVNNQKYKEYRHIGDSGYQIIIGSDVWIGTDVTIMEGVTIGDGAIVAAGSVVVKDVEPYSVVGGVPAKKIKNRFSDDDIKWLVDFKWWNKDLVWIKDHADYFEDIKIFRKKINDEE